MILSYKTISSTVAVLAKLYTYKSQVIPDFISTDEAHELRHLLNEFAQLQFYATTADESNSSIHNDLGVLLLLYRERRKHR